ncbi:unnamed protein product [[Candida] boidinii]|uniref:Unnamed protein product n=1 Tax=Candida boidinii TaxID=5477 RepID=A0A9W6WJ31_CANBO|nr:unnamed protein product [[Candida] boidinii]
MLKMPTSMRIKHTKKDSKIELLRLKLSKENPSGIQVHGSGPNGTVTDRDIQLAKSKALLQSRMAALTGKPAPNFQAYEDNEIKLNQEIKAMTEETSKQQEMIKEIEFSINDLARDISSNLSVSSTDEVGYRKWELGQDIISDSVRTLVKELKMSEPTYASPQAQQQSSYNASASVSNSSSPISQSTVGSNVPSVNNTPAPEKQPAPANSGLSRAEERAKHIKEQAERRMNERLAKLGIRRKPAKSSDASVSPQPAEATPAIPKPQPAEATPAVPKPQPVVPAKSAAPPPPPPVRHSTGPKAISEAPKPSAPVATENNDIDDDDDEDDDDDAEFQKLLAEKKALEAKERERKLKKKKDKEARLAQLKKEMEELKKKEDEDSWDEEDQPSAKNKVENEIKAADELPSISKEKAIAAPETQSNNPFAKLGNGVAPAEAAPKAVTAAPSSDSNSTSAPGHSNNPK